MLTIEQQIERNAQRMPEKVALISGETKVSYGELWAHCCEVAKQMQEDASFYKGKRIILAAAGKIEFVYQYFGIHLAGGICVPIDPDTKPLRREYIERMIAEGEPKQDMADVLFTTGTTGAPKGVVLTHENLAAAARNINEFIGNAEDDVELLALPVSHSFGLGRLRCVLSKGGTMVLLGSFANVKRFFREMENHHVTGFGMVPASWLYLKKMSGEKIRSYADQLKYIEIGSSFMPKEEKELLMEWLPKTRICMHYGLTEASRSAFMEFHAYKDNLLSIGRPAPHADIRIMDGEICVKGEHVCQSYWHESAERIAQDFHGDYFRTGDSGWMDENGDIYIKGRIKEMINVGGEKVSPMEVEDVLNAIPQIRESACCAMQDAVMGEVVEAFIVENEPISDTEIMDIIRPQLENYKWPRKITRIEAIPKTSSGKIQRLQLVNSEKRIVKSMSEEQEYLTGQLLTMEPYAQSAEAEKLYMQALQEELQFHYDHNEAYRQFCERKGFDPHAPLTDIAQIPPVAVSVFKELGFSLASVPKEDIRLRLQSSATSGTPSTIVVDKETSRRQAKAMVKVMQEVIGRERKPFLVMDIDPRSEFKALLGARFAAITGYLNFASKAAYFLKANENRVSYFDVEAMQEYLASLPTEQPVVVFGFTYILYSQVLKALQASDVKLHLPKGSKIIHIGGWKKLESEKVEKSLFNKQLSEVFGIEPTDVVDIYGFTEQMGLNYPDCPCGCKHTSNYVCVLVRDAQTREILPPGREGMLEFVTPVPHSYPGNAVLTDDLGYIVDEPCPCGRGGTRFVVTGRLKKAEIRGCGDILANKLTFASKEVKGERFKVNALDVQSYHGAELTASEPKEQLKEIVGSLREAQTWLREQPVEGLIGLIDAAAKRWISEPKYQILKDKGLLFLSSWCAENNLRRVAQLGLRGNVQYTDRWLAMPDSEKHLMRANARGLVCHWLAGNVQILGLFALVQAILTKNCNLLKVSKNDEGVFQLLLTAFEGLAYTCADGCVIKGDDLLRTIAVVYFPRTADDVAQQMSASADVRIAWGGREAVETVASYPSRYYAETVIFGPKLSMAVIAREDLQEEQEARKLARRVAVDVSIFDQTGCASPHNVYIERGGKVAPEQFCELLTEAMRKTEMQIPKPPMSAEQVSAIHSIRSVYDFCGKVYGSDTMSYTILLDEEPNAHKPVYSRVIFVHVVDNIADALTYVNDDIQTIGISGVSERVEAFASAAAERGAMRFPLIGRMLNFEMPWDGIVLIDRLVKWNTLAGPMC